jgi:hypothetical protein
LETERKNPKAEKKGLKVRSQLPKKKNCQNPSPTPQKVTEIYHPNIGNQQRMKRRGEEDHGRKES